MKDDARNKEGPGEKPHQKKVMANCTCPPDFLALKSVIQSTAMAKRWHTIGSIKLVDGKMECV